MKTQLRNIINFSLKKELAYRQHQPLPILFDHLPKCAGTTIIQYLLTQYPRRVSYVTDGRKPSESAKKFKSFSAKSRHGYHLVVGHCTHQLLDYVHPDSIKLTIFRDPVERIISHYFFVRENKRHYLHQKIIKSNLSLEDYATSELSCELRNFYVSHFSDLLVSQINQNPQQSIERAVKVVLERYDVIGFQDDLTSTMNKLQNLAHLSEPFADRIFNKTQKKAVEKISASTKKAIAQANSLDVELYNRLKTHKAEVVS